MTHATANQSLQGNTGASVRILQITDFHFLADSSETLLGVNTEQTFKQVLEGIRRKCEGQFDLVLATGDLAQDACESSYLRLNQALSGLGLPCYCLPGNHDDPDIMEKFLVSDAIHFQPHVLLGQWQIVCLNSIVPNDARGYLAKSELARLEHCLKQYPDRHALVAMHHHPIPSESMWMDTMQIENASELFSLLSHYPMARAVVFGHVHQAMDKSHQGLRLMSAPSTCFQFKPHQRDFTLDEIPPGFRWLRLMSDGSIETGVERICDLPDGLDLNSSGY